MPSVQEATGQAETQSSNEAVSDTSQRVEKTRGTNVSKAIADDIMLSEILLVAQRLSFLVLMISLLNLILQMQKP